MTEPLRIEHAGAELWLLADKALYWPEQQALLIADIHFGKAAAYRRLGQPVPHGTTAANLQRLDGLLARYPAREIIFLGDFLHAPESRSEATLAALRQWRQACPELRLTLIRGNHDQRAGDPPDDLAVEVVDEPLLRGPFALQHEPRPHPTHAVLAGHLHPAFCLLGKGRQRLRLPCFSFEAQVSLLPAFGEFTGAMEVDAAPGRRLFVVGDGGVWAVGTGSGL
ncbi:ligase-associated DNA damage response endonuclease PdeM [Stutzerimonas nosocomialis]|uniref:ligase-associated DNA damage response endonuclease PdeM n=1 Tax=Stutzerimonas nosocomialis TaxID=1056496 RepID=UPI00110904EC|nr:ligase-associated DNA damage response endonuclease PdeM [Stutzerimonas nosocomialis]TLX56155.1 ligase-associated DNA damage response endonuclease PdeM [Stutzerimonas nosocomialis]